MTDVSAGFRPPCWCPSRWAPTWRLHTTLYKFGESVSPHIFHKKNCCDLNLGEGLCISTFFLFPDSRLNLLNGFYFLFWSILNGVTLKTSNCTSRFGECNFAFWKTHKCKLIPNWTRKTVWLLSNNINMKKFAWRMFWTSELNRLNGFDFLFRSIFNCVTLKTSNSNQSERLHFRVGE